MRIGVDVGGTKLEAIALAENGEALARIRVATPRGDYQQTLDAIVDLVARIERDTGQTGSVGIGMPGAMSPATGLAKNANSTWLNGQPFDKDLSAALNRPLKFANDANCFALSEATDGAAAGAAVVFGVILGTGTGGGLVIDGKVVVGANAIAGEWGHNPLPWPRGGESPGPVCYCGRTGCVETFLSGPGLTRDFELAAKRQEGAETIVELADRGDLAAVLCLERYEDRLTRALAGVINIIDPDVIVLGGGLSNIDRLYDPVATRLTAYVFSDVVATRLVKAKHGDSSGVRGAAWLWPAEASVKARVKNPKDTKRTKNTKKPRVRKSKTSA